MRYRVISQIVTKSFFSYLQLPKQSTLEGLIKRFRVEHLFEEQSVVGSIPASPSTRLWGSSSVYYYRFWLPLHSFCRGRATLAVQRRIAQLVERLACNQEVAGSTPVTLLKHC